LFYTEFLVDKGTELGYWVQRDTSAVKLAPSVGLEALKITYGMIMDWKAWGSNLRSKDFWT